MHRTVTEWMVTILLCVLCAAGNLSAQQALRDSPSHRFIPAGKAPTLDTFRTPEFQKAREEYDEYSKVRRSDRSRRRKNETPSMPTFDPSMLDQLTPETKEQLREWSKASIAEVSKQIGKEIAGFNQRLRQDIGAPEPEAPEEKLPFDFSRDVAQHYENIVKNYREQRDSVNSQFRNALQQHKDKWPSEKIPPEQWLEKVQPFINSEVIEQLRNARDYQDGKIKELPKLPENLNASGPQTGFSARMIESVVKTLDQSGNELIKRAKQNNQGKKQTPWWKRFKSVTNDKIKSINKSITNRTEEYAASTAITSPTTQRTNRESSTTRLPAWNAQTVGLLACIAIVVAGLAYLFFQRLAMQGGDAAEDIASVTDPAAIRDRESLLRAIHGVALKRFGRSSRFWHHRQLFARFRDTVETDDPVIAQLYERARYAPDGDSISRVDLDRARRWCEKARGVGMVQP